MGDMASPAPDLVPDAHQALHCWSFCGGWNPAHWPMYQALYPVQDWHRLINLMMHIRRNV